MGDGRKLFVVFHTYCEHYSQLTKGPPVLSKEWEENFSLPLGCDQGCKKYWFGQRSLFTNLEDVKAEVILARSHTAYENVGVKGYDVVCPENHSERGPYYVIDGELIPSFISADLEEFMAITHLPEIEAVSYERWSH